MKILILGPKTISSKIIGSGLKKKRIKYTQAGLKEIVYTNDRNCSYKFSLRGKDIIKNYDLVFFRAYNRNEIQAKLVAREFLKNKKKVVDKVLGKGQAFFDKLSNSLFLCEKGIKIPKTCNFISKSLFLKFIKKTPFPFVIKNIHGVKGKAVYLIKNKTEAKKFIKKISDPIGKYIIQEFIPHEYSLRIIVLGNKCLGAIKVNNASNDFRSNFSQGGKVEKYEISKELKKLAIESARAVKYDFAGVDILISKRTPLVIEVNETPQIEGFCKIYDKKLISNSIAKYLLN